MDLGALPAELQTSVLTRLSRTSHCLFAFTSLGNYLAYSSHVRTISALIALAIEENELTLTLIQYLWSLKKKFSGEKFLLIIRKGPGSEVLEWVRGVLGPTETADFFRSYLYPEMFRLESVTDSLNKAEWLRTNGYFRYIRPADIAEGIIRYGSMEDLVTVCDRYPVQDFNKLLKLALNQRRPLGLIKFIVERGKLSLIGRACFDVVPCGLSHVLYFADRGGLYDLEDLEMAWREFDSKTYKWLSERFGGKVSTETIGKVTDGAEGSGRPLNRRTLLHVGSEDYSYFISENLYKWSGYEIDAAIIRGNSELVRWLIAQGTPWSDGNLRLVWEGKERQPQSECLYHAMKHNRLEILEFLLEQGTEITDVIFTRLLFQSDVAFDSIRVIARYLPKSGEGRVEWPWPVDTDALYRVAIRSESRRLFLFLLENECPCSFLDSLEYSFAHVGWFPNQIARYPFWKTQKDYPVV